MTRSERRTRVLLADDNHVVREGLKRLINDQPDMEVVGETGDGRNALQLAQRLSPDVALVDVSMPGWDGVRLTREMGGACPSLKVIAVTRHNDGAFVRQMMAAGAHGYILKQSATKNLVAAVRACVGGAVYVDAGVRSATPSSETAIAPLPIAPAQHEPLTTIEDEVLRLFGSASSTQHIAAQLGLDREEVVRAKEAAMRKLGFTTRLQAMNYVQWRTRGSPT
jgi:DNA-binding NarL/FixJ family response regulator